MHARVSGHVGETRSTFPPARVLFNKIRLRETSTGISLNEREDLTLSRANNFAAFLTGDVSVSLATSDERFTLHPDSRASTAPYAPNPVA